MADYVTRLQNEVNGMCSLFFNFAGALQRDAPKASVGGESIAQESSFNVEEQSKLMADQLMEASREIDRIASQLPPLDRSTQERQSKIVEMWKEKIALEEALKTEAEELEMVMSELREVHGTLVADIVAENAEPSDSEADSDDNDSDESSRRADSDGEGNNKDDGPGQANADGEDQGGETTEGPTASGQQQQQPPASNSVLPNHGMKEDNGAEKESEAREAVEKLGRKRHRERLESVQLLGGEGGVGSSGRKRKSVEVECPTNHERILFSFSEKDAEGLDEGETGGAKSKLAQPASGGDCGRGDRCRSDLENVLEDPSIVSSWVPAQGGGDLGCIVGALKLGSELKAGI